MAEFKSLKESVHGWGVDLEAKNRPAGVKEANRESVMTRKHDDYDNLERQVPHVEILVSTEHRKLTPIFSTKCPPKGLSGMVRRLAFKYSEGEKAHWLLLLAADRVDVYENLVAGIFKGKPDNYFKEMGLKTEFTRHGFRSRFGKNRADVRRYGQQALLVAGIGALFLARRALKRRWPDDLEGIERELLSRAS